MLGRIIWLTLILTALMTPVVIADIVCSDNILYQTENLTLSNGTHLQTWVFNRTTECVNGCAQNGVECESASNVPIEFYLAGGLGLAVVAGLFAFLGTKMKEEYGSLQFLFFGGSILSLLILTGLFTGFGIFRQTQIISTMTQAYTMIIVVFMLMFLVFVIKLISSAVSNVSKR